MFCSGCSKNQFKLADTLGQNPELKRVCDECFDELEAVDARTLSTWDTVASKQGPQYVPYSGEMNTMHLYF